MSESVELLRIEGVRKTFPGVVALDSVDFDLRSGEVHVLLGENGAGKSTLIKMLSGAYRPDGGRIFAGGQEVRIHGAQDAEKLGIATIYQEFNLVPDLTVAENIFLGRQPRRFGMIDRRRMEADAEVLLRRVGLHVSPRARVRELGIARLQMVEIAKALSLDARVLIMDEPTAVLTSEEVDKLFGIVKTAARGRRRHRLHHPPPRRDRRPRRPRHRAARRPEHRPGARLDTRGGARPAHGRTQHRTAVPA